jgi:arginyl-tRNA synthetase
VQLFGDISLKHQLQNIVFDALEQLSLDDVTPQTADIIQIEKTRDKQHGDFSSNIAMVLAKAIEKNPRELADKIAQSITSSDLIERVEVAGPGFINFFLTQKAYHFVINEILTEEDKFGYSDFGQAESVLIEFVSANPTGPLHIGHGRGAAYGEAVANLLKATGYHVDKEYYVNDAGRQMDILILSIWLRYLEIHKIKIDFPEQAYKGEYIIHIASELKSEKGNILIRDISALESKSEADFDKQLDNAIKFLKLELDEEEYEYVLDLGLNKILEDIRTDLEEFGITYDNWFSERELLNTNLINECVQQLQSHSHIYEQEGAQWFRSSELGDEKDRVIIRDNGQSTYFASDIAYHKAKFDRGYSKIIDIWGADHHGYIARVKAALKAMDEEPEKLEILLVQFASLYRGKEKVQMSTRSGQFVTLKELREEIGNDAARFFYVMRKNEQHLDFDLELAKSESNDNPVYYIQYAHARICSVLKQLNEKGFNYTVKKTIGDLALLKEPHELDLLTLLAQFPEIVHSSATNYAPHQVCYYLRDLAYAFHTYYNACQFLVDNESLRNARITLICSVRQVIRNGLALLGVSAPETM